MRVNAEQSRYHEADDIQQEFTRDEIRSLRILLRRLRFLDNQVEEKGGLSDPNANGGAAFAEWERDALAYALTELGFIKEIA